MYSQSVFLRTYRTKSQQLDQEYFRTLNPYDEQQGKLHFLHKKPLCILLLGHPCTGKTTLARKLCQKWKLQLVNATELIKQHLDFNTEVGRKLNETLLNGDALDEETVFNLIDQKLNAPECSHYGYLLDDFPAYGKAGLTTEQQLQYILTLKLKPDCIIKIEITEDDLRSRRSGLKVDPDDGNLYTRRSYEPEPQIIGEPQEAKVPATMGSSMEAGEALNAETDAQEEIEEEPEEQTNAGHPDFPHVNNEVKERLVTRIEDIQETIDADNSHYKERVSSHLRYLIGRHNPLNVIELDGNQTPTECFQNLMVRLQSMNLYPSVAPTRFFSSSSLEEEEAPEEMETEELFRTLAIKKMPGPRCRWRRSPWQQYCPVALYKGILALGKPEYTVGFLGNIYCMHSEEHLSLFMANPRPYLLPPQPRPPFRLMVVGPTASGKSTLIRLLAEKYGARVLDLVGMFQEEHDRVLMKRLADVEAATEAEVIAEVKERYDQELLALKTNKMAEDAVDDMVDKVADELEQDAIEAATANVEDERIIADLSELPTDMESAIPVTPRRKEKLYIPKHLREPVNRNHPEVKTRVREALNNARQIPVELDAEIYMDAVRAAVEEAEERLRTETPLGPIRGNWILDGMPMRQEVWKAFIEKAPDLLPDLVVGLMDGSAQGDFLLKRWYVEEREGLAATKTVTSSDSTDKEVSDEIEPASEQVSATESKELGAPPPGRLRDMALAKLKGQEKQWSQTANLLRSVTTEYGVSIDTLTVDIVDKSFEQLRDEVLTHMQKPFRVDPVETNQAELEEEEEEDAEAFEEEEDDQLDNEAMAEGVVEEEQEQGGDAEAMGEGEEAEEEDEEVDPSRNADKRLGLTSYFCPVTLHDHGLLRAGNPDIGAQLDGLVYYFASEEARSKFMAAPEAILCDDQNPIRVPPPRILILGPNGSGKTLHGRQLAAVLDIFFINFECLLQEIVLPKVGHKLGREYEDLQPVPDIVLPPLEESDSVNLAQPIMKRPTIRQIGDLASGMTEGEEMTEQERDISEYLINGTPLPSTTLDWILARYWTQEPYKSKGFVMEGFPLNLEQAQFLISANYLPELIVVLNTEANEVVGRLLPGRLESWRIKMAKKAANAALLKEWKAAKKEIARQKRRAERIAELQAKREQARAGRNRTETDTDEDDDALEDEVDNDELLANDQEENDAEVASEEKETEADAIERLTEEITERCEETMDKLTEALELFEEIPVRKIELEAGGKVTWIRYRLVKRINAWIENREALFERVYPVTPKVAERLVANGYKFPSRFGRWCPVTRFAQRFFLPPICVRPIKVAHEKYLPILPGIVGETLPPVNPNTCAAVYKDNVYWFSNNKARTLFSKNPLRYLQGRPNPPVCIPLRVAIVGAPKTGKTTLAKRLAQEYSVPLINVSDALNWYLHDPSHAFTSLAERMRTHMDNGDVVPDSMVASVLQTLTMNSVYQTRGYILDGFPMTIEQAKQLSLHRVRPGLIIELKATTEDERQELMIRAIDDAKDPSRWLVASTGLTTQTTSEENQLTDADAPGSPVPRASDTDRPEEGFHVPISESDAVEDYTIKLQAYEYAAKARNEWIKTHQGILVTLNAIQSRWNVWNQVVHVVRHRMQHLQEYMGRILTERAASIAELGIEERRFQQRVGGFLQFCPVSLKERGELEDTINEPKHELAITLSMDEPLPPPPSCPQGSLDSAYPCTLSVDADQRSMGGQTIRIESRLRFAAEYRGRYYRMAGPEELAKFLEKPDQYLPPFVSQTIPPRERLPVRLQADAVELSRNSFPTQVALRGYCPVCFVNGKLRYEGLRLGSQEHLAKFDGTIYTFCSNDCVLEFLRKPASYENLQLPHKLPPLPTPVDVKSLPIPGFLEQTLAKSLQTALSSVGQERPKFPFLSIKRSAVIYLALYMKAHNPLKPECERQKYEQKLTDFVDACCLPEWLSKKMPLSFQPKQNRPKNMTARLENFLNLKDLNDQPLTWSSNPSTSEKTAVRGTRFSLKSQLHTECEFR